MGKKKSTNKSHEKKIKLSQKESELKKLESARTGGQNALRGFSYQFLYSCYLILSELDQDTIFHLEGIEDIDKIEFKNCEKTFNHVQIKYSIASQDASFLKDVLKNFLEVYLNDKTRKFKLVYNFEVAQGHLSKLFAYSLDDKSNEYWKKIINNIKSENNSWCWDEFIYDEFIENIKFEKNKEDLLSTEIEKKLIENYDISVNNIMLYTNAVKVFCLDKMKDRGRISKNDFDKIIQNVKDDIEKGTINPAHNWISKIDFDTTSLQKSHSYYEGKKATAQDIIAKLPVRRPNLEQQITSSISEKRVTVIKASSGQGKTTLALQVAFDLQKEYKIYKLSWCNDYEKLNYIVEYFKSRVKLGEKPLILLDNLDSQMSEWNKLAQRLQEEVSYNYKLLITAREDDWYNYRGDLSNIRELQEIELILEEKEAKEIYNNLKKSGKLHDVTKTWNSYWSKVSDKKLLIEYIYLLTHGEMIKERIENQISQISKGPSGKVKCEILRKICFADICGINLPVRKLISNLDETTNDDYGEIFKSIENEFFIRIEKAEKYVEGLHPVRSQHIVEKLHEFSEISDTAIQVTKISDKRYLPKLFYKFPGLIKNKDTFYKKIVEVLWNSDDLSDYLLAIKGTFSGSVIEYFYENRHIYDDANEHGGLMLVDMELNPFTDFKEHQIKLKTLNKLQKIIPEDENIQYLCRLKDEAPKIVLNETDVYCLCEALFHKLNNPEIYGSVSDVQSYSSIAYWLLKIDSSLNLTPNISLDMVWLNKQKYTQETLLATMYSSFLGNKEHYMNYVKRNLEVILSYLKSSTKSLNIEATENMERILIKYVMLPSNIENGNIESVSRLQIICKMLPIFSTYCAESYTPTVEIISAYKINNGTHKEMPIRDLIITFHTELTELWSKTIMSNYESNNIHEWLEHWFSIRTKLSNLFDLNTQCIIKLLQNTWDKKIAEKAYNLMIAINKTLIKEYKFPNEDRPFDEKAKLIEGFEKIKNGYFSSTRDFYHNFHKLSNRDSESIELILIILKNIQSNLDEMQEFFLTFPLEKTILQQYYKLGVSEKNNIKNIIEACSYFQQHLPTKNFNKHILESWYREQHNLKIENVRFALKKLANIHPIIFSNNEYFNANLSYYPIISDNLNFEDEEVRHDFFYSCVPFAELKYDYLTIIFKNEEGKIIKTALNITRDFLHKFKKISDSGDHLSIDKLIPPFTVDVTVKMLKCFEYQFEIEEQNINGYEEIDKIGQLLWAFYKTRKELIDDSDKEYKEQMESIIKKEVYSHLKFFEYESLEEFFLDLSKLCNSVFNGQEFDDLDFNNFFYKFINKLKSVMV